MHCSRHCGGGNKANILGCFGRGPVWRPPCSHDRSGMSCVASAVTHSDKNKDDANCDFTLHDKSFTTVLRIEVETMTEPPASFASHAAQCGPHAAQLKAIGNEAVACRFDGKK